MMGAALSHDPQYFHTIYAEDRDPWGFEVRWYERRKFALTLALLPKPRYACAFEPGCANGALTELLQARCDRVVAYELVPEVAMRARERLAAHSHVDVRAGAIPRDWPDQRLDLVVLSEIAYYLTTPGRDRALWELERSLEHGGDVVAVHYTGVTDYPMRGEEVGAWLDGVPWLDRLVDHTDPQFVAGVWRRRVPGVPVGISRAQTG